MSSLNDSMLNTTMAATTNNESTNAYDHLGAALYIAVILIWYSNGLAMMLFLQVRPRSFEHQFSSNFTDSLKKNKHGILSGGSFSKYRDTQVDDDTKQCLNELKDPERRKRLWKIYYASSDKQDEPDPQYYQTLSTETATINRINRKLANIRRTDGFTDDLSIQSDSITGHLEGRVNSPFEPTKFFTKHLINLRRTPINSPNTATNNNSRPVPINKQSENRETSPVPKKGTEFLPLVPPKSPATPPSNIPRKSSTLFIQRFEVEPVSE